MFTKLDPEVENLLCCSFCKGKLDKNATTFVCQECSTSYSSKSFSVGDHEESIFDFRLHHPSYCVPPAMKRWAELQDHYEHTQKKNVGRDKLQQYLDEIDSVKEIYHDEFCLKGRVLDVGGHLGKLRHFLGNEVQLYVSVDPFWNSFQNIQAHPDLLKAYPCINDACNFISSLSEFLPFASNSFDWVHMRSVIDHFADPFLAFKDAYRVLRPGGQLMIGLAIVERMTASHSNKKRNVLAKCFKKLKAGKQYSFKKDCRIFGGPDDDHMYRFKYHELLELFSVTGFQLEKEHFQKEPFSYCAYLSGKAGEKS